LKTSLIRALRRCGVLLAIALMAAGRDHCCAQEPAGAAQELMLAAGEIRFDGTIGTVDVAGNSFVLDVSVFTLPNGKSSQFPAAKPKTVLVTRGTSLHVRGHVETKVALDRLKAGVSAIVIGLDEGSGKAITAREVAVWDRTEGEEFRLGEAVPPPAAPLSPVTGDTSRPELVPQVFHTRMILALAFAPDGERLATASADGTVKLWNAQSGELHRTLSGVCNAVAYSPDGTILATAGDGAVQLRDAHSGQVRRSLPVGAGKVGAGAVGGLAFSPDGKSLVVAGAKDTVTWWDTSSGQLQATITFSDTPARHVAGGLAPGMDPKLTFLRRTTTSIVFSPDLKTAATAHRLDENGAPAGGEVKLWDLRSGQLLHTLMRYAVYRSLGRREREPPPPTEHLSYAAFQPAGPVVFSPDGKTLISSNRERAGAQSFSEMLVWDVPSGGLKTKLKGAPRVFTPDGGTLLINDETGALALLDLQTGAVKQRMMRSQNLGATIFSPDGQTVAAGSDVGGVRLFETATGRPNLTLERFGGGVRALIFAPDGKTLVSVDNGVRLWSLETGELKRSWQINGLISGRFAPDGKTLATLSSQLLAGQYLRELRLWDVETGAPQQPLVGKYVAYTPDLSLAVVANTIGQANQSGTLTEVKLADPRTGQIKGSIGQPGAGLDDIALSGDGHTLALSRRKSAGRESVNEIELWDVPAGRLRHTLDARTAQVTSRGFSFSPDNRLLLFWAITYQDREFGSEVRVWDVTSGELKQGWKEAGTQRQPAAAFGPDSRTVVMYVGGAEGGKTALRDIATGESKRTLENWPAFLADGQTWATGVTEFKDGFSDNTVKLWDARTGELQRTLIGGSGLSNTISASPDGSIVGAGGADGMVTLWDAKSGRLLASLLCFPAEGASNEYLAFTSEGYYSGSQSVDTYVRFRVGDELFPAKPFRKRHYRPELVRQSLAGQAPPEENKGAAPQ